MAMAADTDTGNGNGNGTGRPRGDMDNHKPSSRDTYITYIHSVVEILCVCVCVSATTQIAMHVCVTHLAREGAGVGEGEELHVCINPFDAFI